MVIGSPKLQTVDLGSRDCLSGKRKRNETRRQVKGEHKAARGGEGVGRSTAARVPEGSRGRWARVRGVLTVDHGQPGLVQEANPAVLEKPDGEDGEREQQDEGEQAHAVLPVALLCLLLRGELLHGAAVLSRRPRGGGRGRPAQPPTQQQREQRHQQQPRWQRPGRPPRAEARRVTRLHGPSAARASCTLGPAARTVGSFPWRHRPARVAAAAAAPPPARARQGPGTRRESRWGRGARSAQDPQAPPPARVPVWPPAAPRPPPPTRSSLPSPLQRGRLPPSSPRAEPRAPLLTALLPRSRRTWPGHLGSRGRFLGTRRRASYMGRQRSPVPGKSIFLDVRSRFLCLGPLEMFDPWPVCSRSRRSRSGGSGGAQEP